jgi:glycosyltransferase involved in cell wall biosynthesis
MKIGLFTTDFAYKPPFYYKGLSVRWGGIAEVVYNLALNLGREHEVKVFTTSPAEELRLDYGYITVLAYKKMFKFENTDVSFDLLRKPMKHNLDIVHIHSGTPPGCIAGYLYAKMKKKKYILSYHGDLFEGFGGPLKASVVKFFNQYVYPKVLRDASIITALSNQYLAHSKLLKNYEHKTVIIPNGVNLEEFDISISKEECRRKLGLPLDKKIILFVGDITPWKAPHVLIKAMKEVLKSVPESFLVIVGQGRIKTKLEELSTKSEIKKNVMFPGFIKGEELITYYKSADVFVLPSFEESFPMVLLEASASGLPLIVSNLKSFESIVKDGYNGFFTRTGNDRDLATKIIYLLENEEVRKRIGRNARQKVKEFSWERVAEETKKIYLRLIENGKRT